MYKRLLIFCISCLIAGCGGSSGGSSSGPVTSTLTFPVGTAITNLLTNGFSSNFTISGKLNNQNVGGSGSVSENAAKAATFEGQQAFENTLTVTATVTSSNGSSPFGVTAQSYSDTNYNPIGVIGGSEYDVAQGNSSLPSSVKVGNTGVIATYNRYSDSSKTTPLGTEQESYTIQSDTATSAIVDLITNVYDTTKTQTMSDQARYRIDQNGTITWLSLDYNYLSGSTTGTLTLKRK